jgi:hypothetical protein
MCRSKPEELRAIQSEAEWLALRAQDVGEPFVAHLIGMVVVELAELVEAAKSKEGTELPDMNAIRSEAIRASGQMLADLGSAWGGEQWQMNVADESGRVVFRLEFSATELPPSATE